MDHGALDSSMFWVGALFVFTPIIFASILLGFWWQGKKRNARSRTDSGRNRPEV